MTAGNEFQEIAHSGGKMTIDVVTDAEGRRQYSVGWRHDRPVPAALFAVWALPQGAAVDDIDMGGIGTPWNPPPVPGCFPVIIGSDSEGKFGHQCPSCSGYWRTRGGPALCPYCATRGARYCFLTDAQRRYVAQCCERFYEALASEEDGQHVIDMDAVADAVGKDSEKPPFYYAEESQQKHFNCEECGEFNDIIGKFCYCSACGTRNDFRELQIDTLAKLRARANSGGGYEACVSDAVGAFDTFVGEYVREMVRRVPMSPARTGRLERMRFHNLQATSGELANIFDIDILNGISDGDTAFAMLLFHRRHLYEHTGGVVDEKYLAASGDTSVRLRQEIHETQGSAHRLIGIIATMARTLHAGFHAIFPPLEKPIQRYARRGKATRSESG